MKKRFKLAIAVAATIAAMECINRIIFKKGGIKPDLGFDEKTYAWKFGEIRYTEAGSGKPVLLIHDTVPGGGIHEWNKCISALAKRHKVYALDLLGYGFSEKPPLTYSAYMFSALINDFIKNVIKEKAVAITSGSSAKYVFAGYSLNPDMYRKIMAVSPEGLSDSRGGCVFGRLYELPVLGAFLYNMKFSKFGLHKSFINTGFSDKKFADGKIIDEYYAAAHYGGENAVMPFAALNAGFLDTDTKRLLSAIEIPVRVVFGDGDKSALSVEQLADINSGASLVVFENAKRFPHIENARKFIREFEAFV